MKVAILYPGDMGAALGRLFFEAGHEPVTVTTGRSDASIAAAERAGFRMHADLGEVARIADLVISLVPPAAVVDVARSYVRAARSLAEAAPFVDMNAKSLQDVRSVERLMEEAGVRFTNACIIGMANNVGMSKILTSGRHSEALDAIAGSLLTVEHLGERIEQATAFKMAFAGFNKALTAALFETAITAHGFAIFEPLIAELELRLPGVMADLSHLLPSYPRHAARRADEMRALSLLLAEHSLPTEMASAAGRTFDMAQAALAAACGESVLQSLARIVHRTRG